VTILPTSQKTIFTSGFIVLKEVQFQVETDNDGVIVISGTQNVNIFDVVADGLF
jgi:hypothetical protein